MEMDMGKRLCHDCIIRRGWCLLFSQNATNTAEINDIISAAWCPVFHAAFDAYAASRSGEGERPSAVPVGDAPDGVAQPNRLCSTCWGTGHYYTYGRGAKPVPCPHCREGRRAA